MKIWDLIFKLIILIMGGIVIAFNAQLYNFCKDQKVELSSVKDKQDVEAEFNSNKFKFEQDQIDRIGKDLENARQQIKDQQGILVEQKDNLLQEADKRAQMENESKEIQTSLVDVKAEADAIKQDMKGWQKDYVGVLAQLDKKMDDTQVEVKGLENSLTALNIPEIKENINSMKVDIDKLAHPMVQSSPSVPTDTEKKTETNGSQSSN